MNNCTTCQLPSSLLEPCHACDGEICPSKQCRATCECTACSWHTYCCESHLAELRDQVLCRLCNRQFFCTNCIPKICTKCDFSFCKMCVAATGMEEYCLDCLPAEREPREPEEPREHSQYRLEYDSDVEQLRSQESESEDEVLDAAGRPGL